MIIHFTINVLGGTRVGGEQENKWWVGLKVGTRRVQEFSPSYI